MLRIGIPLTLLVVACLGSPTQADEEDGADRIVVRRVDLARYRVAPPPVGPRISIPTDLIEMTEDPRDVGIWNVDWHNETGTWLPFDEPHLAERVFTNDVAIELLQAVRLPAEGDVEEVDLDSDAGGLTVRGRAQAVEQAAGLVPWVLEALAPSLRVDAVLTSGQADEPLRIRAVGGVRLWPDRWTRVYLQVNEVPCTVHWDIEVAQEATTMDPLPMEVREGRELYLRYHPGQSVSVVEVWAGGVDHLEIVREDLSALRNVPEANGPGVLSLPRSAVQRAFSALVVPSGRTAEREITWSNEDRRHTLQLAFSAAPSPQAPILRAAGTSHASVRVGALANALEFDARAQSTEHLVDRLSGVLYEAGLAYEERGDEYDYGVTTVGGPSVLLLQAPGPVLEKVLGAHLDAERALVARTLALRVLTVPEPSFQAAVRAGTLRVGRVLSAEVEDAFRQAGASMGEAVRTPVLLGARAGFRVGRSVPGLVDLDAEIAQSAAGLRPATSARFAGLFGEVRLRATPDGHALWVRGGLSWADPAAGSVELVFRRPVSMKGEGEASGPAAAVAATRKVSLPILGGGSTPVETEIEIPAGNERDWLLHVHVRGDEVVLLLARVQ